MTTIELAEKIYKYVNSIECLRHGARWDEWDDKREIEFIRSLIDNHHTKSDHEKLSTSNRSTTEEVL